jgi:hypothetical protein
VIDQVHRICDLAEVPRVTAHAMRGLLATLTAERRLAGHLIAATLGHEDERTTMTAYAAPSSAAAGARLRGWSVLNGGVQPAKKVRYVMWSNRFPTGSNAPAAIAGSKKGLA